MRMPRNSGSGPTGGANGTARALEGTQVYGS